MNDFAILYVRAQRLNSLLYSPSEPALHSSARMLIGSFVQTFLTDTNIDQSNVFSLIRDWSNPPANQIHLKRVTNV